MELSINKRNAGKKSETKHLRHLKLIPAVIYAAGKPNENITVDEGEFQAVLRGLKPDHLSTTVFHLMLDGEKLKALVKDIQYHRITYRVEHLDFMLLDEKRELQVNVPIFCAGTMECMGIKLGGALRQVIRKLKVTCLPKHIPDEFVIDVSKMQINESRKLSDIVIPAGVRPRASMDEVALAIVKR